MEALMGSGLKANVTDKLNEILLRAVTSGAKFADLQEELRTHLLGKDGGQGAFARYATTYATTALSQFTGQNNKLLTDDLDTEWFMYVGSNKETTRPFCEACTRKKYIHRSEIHTLLTGHIHIAGGDDVDVPIYAKTGLPYGMIEGTNEENFQINVGGWNCRHQLVPVADAVVPKNIREEIEKKAKPTIAEKPNPLDLTEYKDQISVIKQYIAEHPKSEKIKGYYNSIIQVAADGDEESLKTILKAAKSDIAKFIAAKKAIVKKKITEVTNTKSSAKQHQKFTPLKKEYKTLQDIQDTISAINKKTNWFDYKIGVGKLQKTTRSGINGWANRFTGEIALTPQRADWVTSAMDKIAKGKSEDITKDEADAMATYWHEITHNRNHTGTYTGPTKKESEKNTPFMECANEYIARETMEEFYNALGCPIPKNAKPFMEQRTSTGYDNDVQKLKAVINGLNCDKQKMNSILQDKLFNCSYDSLKDGIATALYESGGKDLVYDKKEKTTAFTKKECLKLVGYAIGKYMAVQSVKWYIEFNYPNLRKNTKKESK